MQVPPGNPRTRAKSLVALLLTFAAGIIDIVGYITVYHLFVAHMTGNTGTPWQQNRGRRLERSCKSRFHDFRFYYRFCCWAGCHRSWRATARTYDCLCHFVRGGCAGARICRASRRRACSASTASDAHSDNMCVTRIIGCCDGFANGHAYPHWPAHDSYDFRDRDVEQVRSSNIRMDLLGV